MSPSTTSSSTPASEAFLPQSPTTNQRSKFDPQSTLSSTLSHLLDSKLKNQSWDKNDKEKNRSLSKSIAEAAKATMLEIQPKGFKYVVQTQLQENLGQGGRADLACHWEDTDSVTQEIFANDSLICTVICFAIRVA
ncbi:hypothetical protein IE53DRAFT_347023 [Violaceomyces palustris]|uniref:Uncharacterized protein n=1 Tax=Violaceomyces palustris TaxID=1673888 RepID=A0ACD0NSC2_9BASI|nr:hypothetical protein IE53DRAFT_347023 [Violaceomyces palustris]